MTTQRHAYTGALTDRDLLDAACTAVEDRATALLRSRTGGGSSHAEESVSAATRESIAWVIQSLIRSNPAPGAQQIGAPRSRRSERTLRSLAAQVARHDQPASLDALYQSLLGHEPRYDAETGSIALVPATSGRRRSLGSFYTPGTLVDHLLSTTLEPVIEERLASVVPCADPLRTMRRRCESLISIRVCDPACGSGRFLVAAGEMLASRLASERAEGSAVAAASLEQARREVHQTCLFGVDIDPVAVTLCRHALDAPRRDGKPGTDDPFRDHVRLGNALLWADPERPERHANRRDSRLGPFHWDRAFPEIFDSSGNARCGFDVVVGNPPFLNQLEQATANDREYASMLHEIYDGAISGYTDTAVAFLLLARRLTAPGGRTAMVMPQSFLAARDAAIARTRLLDHARLESLWVSNERVFPGASVYTCAPTLRDSRERAGTVRRFSTSRFVECKPLKINADRLAGSPTWSHLAPAASGIPEFRLTPAPPLSGLCDATADFRDQYYGLDGFIVEHDDLTPDQQSDFIAFPPIVTSGLIDLAECRWGTADCRLLKTRWRAPRIDRSSMERDGALGPWLTARLVPKLLLATQTRAVEVFVDPEGRYVPSVPLITVTPKSKTDLWRIAAALASPALSAYAFRRYAGAALHADAIKLSARQVLDLPCPTSPRFWDEAAEHFKLASCSNSHAERDSSLEAFGTASGRAYGLTQGETRSLLEWWRPRTRRRTTPRRGG